MIYSLFKSQTITIRARTKRTVKGKHSWFHFFNPNTVFRTCKLCAENFFIGKYKSVAMTDCKLNSYCQSAFNSRLDNNSVNDNFNGMLKRFFERNFILIQLKHFSINSCSGKPFFSNPLQYFFMLPLAVSDNRGKYDHSRSLFKLHN